MERDLNLSYTHTKQQQQQQKEKQWKYIKSESSLARPRIPFQSPSTSSSPFLSFYSLFKALRLSAITMGKAEVNHHHPHLCNQKRERERERETKES